MSRPTRRRGLARATALSLVLLAILTLVSPGAGALAAPGLATDTVPGATKAGGLYIVRMADAPVITYDGGIPGLAATRPAKGAKLDPNSPAVRNYVRYLEDKHDAKLRRVGGSKLYSYRYTFNGFAAALTGPQAARLMADPEVLAVEANEIHKLDTSSTPAFLKLDAAGGIWEQLGGPTTNGGPNSGGAGEGVIVGIVDSGIWPENPSFSDRDANGKLVFQQIPGWHGKCVPGEQFTAANCNQKLIGAQWFGAGYGGPAGIKEAFPYEFVSARDADGHGSHTASTAAGNYGVSVTVDGADLGTISGMAPRARVAAYKACWGNGGQGGCPTVDTLAAIDQAVADGVDVINYSISGSTTSVTNVIEQAFLNASDAGVFVAASAGNSGPGASTVAHNSPWIATVAAGTHDRGYSASVTLGDGQSFSGPSSGAGASAALINSDAAGLAGANAGQVALCYPGTLDPAAVGGKIVVCDRGVIGRTEKSRAVKLAGGVGMILVNTGVSSLNADLHFVPTIHLQSTDRAAVRAYAATPGATATISAGTQVTATAPLVASFSSRGVALAGAGDLLKPDIMAPGVDVLAAVSPIGYNGRNYDLLSGTSMSSPHIAGIAALMKDRFPSWTPAMIKSALMTTSSTTNNAGGPIAREEGGLGNPFAYGAGHVVPNAATNPGLVYDADTLDYIGYICGIGQASGGICNSVQIDPSDLNYPSISIGSLAGSQTIKRTVTSVAETTETYTANISAPAGITVEVTPSSFTIAPGATQEFTVKLTRTTAALNAYSFGALTWQSDSGISVRSPLVVRPVALGAPVQVNASAGGSSYGVSFGYDGPFTASARGLVPANTIQGNVVDDPSDDINTALGTGVGITFHTVSIPAGTTYARFSLFDDFTDGADDLDLYVFRPNGSYAGGSGGGTSAEEFNVLNPAAGNWTVVVHGWQTDGADSNYTLFSWAIGNTPAGNMTVAAPASASLGGSGTIQLSFSGLAANTKYLGSVAYSGAAGMPNPTIISVNTP